MTAEADNSIFEQAAERALSVLRQTHQANTPACDFNGASEQAPGIDKTGDPVESN